MTNHREPDPRGPGRFADDSRWAPGAEVRTTDLLKLGRDELVDAYAEPPAPRSVMQEAHDLVTGDRAAVYGEDTLGMARRIAAGWGAILGADVSPENVALMLAWLKIARECNQHKRDNLVDLAGYAGVAERVRAGLEAEQLDDCPPPIHVDLSRVGDAACPHCSIDLGGES